MNQNDLLDDHLLDDNDYRTPIEIINSGKFFLFYILTLGLYGVWWMYKTWRFFQQKNNLDIWPVARAIFGIFFFYPLAEGIKNYAHKQNVVATYSSGLLLVVFIAFNLIGNLPLPDIFGLAGIFAVVCFIPLLNAFNAAVVADSGYQAVDRQGLNTRQIILVVLGALFWIVIFAGLFLSEDGGY